MLRIIEMAVKRRCQQLNISLEAGTTKNGKTITRKKVLKELMTDIVSIEPGKMLQDQFEAARSLRNLEIAI